MATSVINPLLSYVAFRMKTSSPIDVIRMECVEFYSAEEIVEARDALWGIDDGDVQTTIPEMVRRQSMDQRKGCEKTVADICAALMKLDVKNALSGSNKMLFECFTKMGQIFKSNLNIHF